RQTAEYPRFLTNPILSVGHDIPLPKGKALWQRCAEMRIDSIQITTQGLGLRVKYRNICQDYSLSLTRPGGEDTYVVSNSGEGLRIAEFPKDAFPDEWNAGTLFDRFDMYTRTILPNEVWMLKMWFPPLKEPAKQLAFTHFPFDKVEITLLD
ncbi:MAG: hypothetical protein PHF11_07845, partial [Candidatus Omnitrophica bacterium]|nr:hypothetical protein [Candidatus Omnitrophota bacterium]